MRTVKKSANTSVEPRSGDMRGGKEGQRREEVLITHPQAEVYHAISLQHWNHHHHSFYRNIQSVHGFREVRLRYNYRSVMWSWSLRAVMISIYYRSWPRVEQKQSRKVNIPTPPRNRVGVICICSTCSSLLRWGIGCFACLLACKETTFTPPKRTCQAMKKEKEKTTTVNKKKHKKKRRNISTRKMFVLI